MDIPGHPHALVRGNLADLKRVNRWLGGTRLTLRGLGRILYGVPSGSTVILLDIGSGAMDIPAAADAYLRRRGFRSTVVATDVNETILGATPRPSRLRIVAADARRLPFADRSVDIATCSLMLHHLGPSDAITMLGEMCRVARRAVLVNDLVRSRFGLAAAWLLSLVATHNPLSRNDAPLSVRRAYTKEEMRALAERAGLQVRGFDAALFHRVSMWAIPPS